VWVLIGIDQTLVLWRPISSSVTSGRVVSNANQWRPNASTRLVTLVRERVHISDRYDRTNEMQRETCGIHLGSHAGATGR
jgi:hypothetical protein